MKKDSISILAFDRAFIFDTEESEGARYELDHAVSVSEGWTLTLNADREVYACVAEPDGQKHYGTIGDEEDEVIPDNFGFCAGDRFFFYEKPETEEYYV